MIKIIFCDMDGTLLTRDNKLPEDFDEMIFELKKRNVIFAPASGRQYFSLLRSFKKYRDDFLFISEGGTIVFYKGQEIFSVSLEPSQLDRILNVCKTFGEILCVWCGKENAYILREFNKPEYINELEKYYTHRTIINDWNEIKDTAIKIALFDKSGHAKESIYDKLFPFYNNLQITLSSDCWVDISASNINKATAIRSIQKNFNIKLNECAAFGDYMNDYEMFRAVEYSFAMANAHPHLKEIAKFETLSNNENGVLIGIRKLINEGLI